MKKAYVMLLVLVAFAGVCFASLESRQNKREFNLTLAAVNANQQLLDLRNQINNQLVEMTADDKITVGEWKKFVNLNHKFETHFQKALVKYGDQYLKYIDARLNTEIKYLIMLQDSSEKDDITSLPRNTIDLEIIISNLTGKDIRFEPSGWLKTTNIFLGGIVAGILICLMFIGFATIFPMFRNYFGDDETT